MKYTGSWQSLNVLRWVGLFFLCGLALVCSKTGALAQREDLYGMANPLAPATIPSYGSFWLLVGPAGGRPCPPLPCPPRDLIERGAQVYQLGPRTFIVDDRRIDYDALRVERAQQKLARSGMEAFVLESLERSYGPNDLWFELSLTNLGAGLTIHTAEEAAYDLFGTTNLTVAAGGLNATNWAWLLRTQQGQTNGIIVTNLWIEMGFFRLGTMLDSDADGATDAYEELTAHTDPQDPCSAPVSNQNGVPDWLEVQMGFDPTQPNSLGQSQPGYGIFVAQPAGGSGIP